MSTLPRLVATDLDGTLLRSDGTVSAYSSEVLRLLADKGVDLIVVTARPPRWLDALRALTGTHGLAVCCNGAVLYDVGAGRVLQSEPLLPATVREVAARLSVCTATVYSLCSRGLLRFIRVSGALRIDPASVEAFITAGGVGPGQN